MSKNLDWAKYFWTQWQRPAKKFAGTRRFGLFTKNQFAVAVSCRFPIGCFIVNCLIAFKLSQYFISAAAPEVGKNA